MPQGYMHANFQWHGWQHLQRASVFISMSISIPFIHSAYILSNNQQCYEAVQLFPVANTLEGEHLGLNLASGMF